MEDNIILLMITYYFIGVACIIIALNLIQYFNKKKYKSEMQELDVEKNQILDAPILSELSKVEALKTKSIKDKYKLWKKEIESIKTDLESSINDMILDADFSIEQKDYKDFLKKKINIEIKLLELKEQKERLLEEIKEITLSEERNRVLITELKTKYRDIVHNFETNKGSFSSVANVVELQIETIEKRFLEFEKDLEKQDYISANKMVKLIDKLVKHLETIVDEIPPSIAMIETIIPKRLEEVSNTYENMVKSGFQLDYLNIEYNINEIDKKLKDIMSRIRVLNLEDALFELRTILEYTDSIFTDFEREKIARKEYEESVTLFKSKIKKINEVMNKLYGKVVDSKYNYKLSEGQLKSLDDLSNELVVLDEDFDKLLDATRTSSFPYTRLNKEQEILILKLSKVEERLDSYMQSIGSMQEDEKRAREQLEDMSSLLELSKSKIREYKLPLIPDLYFVELKEAMEAVREVNKELDRKPINIDILNTRVDTARDLIFKFNNTSNELVKAATLAENAIIYGNRYRVKKQYVNEGLNKAEVLFLRGDYKKALELTLNTIDMVEPGIYKKLSNLYEKNSK
ncbi:MAG: septation ring formation regulator EzrA [Bacilli bacterium]|nr:septation ring formation regulator EzrA [Bacilli bacterium]